MDILKVLSRGIKQPAKNGKPSGQGAVNLPSAGNKAHPQLFHDETSTSRGNKRKRRSDDHDGDDDDAALKADGELPEVDFFAPKQSNEKKSRVEDATAADSASAPPTQHQAGKTKATASRKPTPLTEDECRTLLRSHRLKMTLLSARRKKEAKVTKSKGQKKKTKTVAVEVKEEPMQLHPQPLTSFSDLRTIYDISPQLAANLRHEGYKVPTEVQLGSLPLLLRPSVALKSVPAKDEFVSPGKGVDFLAVAPTGSGKTISFLIPAIDDILRRRTNPDDQDEHELGAIVVAPTRELVFQIVNEGRKLALGTGIKVVGMRKGLRLPFERVEQPIDDEVAVEGGEEKKVRKEEESDESDEAAEEDEEDEDDSDDDEKENSKPATKADILVATPALLQRYLASQGKKYRKTLPTVRSLVLDEADVLLDPLFREQTTGVWSACTNPELRTTFWSATMGSNIETLVKDMLSRKPDPNPLIRLVVGLKDTAVPNVTHKLIYAASEQGKLLGIRQLLHPTAGGDSGPPLRPPFLVFTQTIDRASALEEELKYDIPLSAGGPARVASLHSGLTESVRAGIMRRFRAGEIWVLVTTDVLARGVDFAGVNGIVNYDIPGSTAAYVHRAGRTGRAGREGGVAVTFYTKEDVPFVKTVANVIAASEKQAGKPDGEGAAIQKWLLDALPDVSKQDRKKLRERGVESRRSGGADAKITSQSGWERRRENNRKGAVEGSKRRVKQARREAKGGGGGVGGRGADSDGEWGGIDG